MSPGRAALLSFCNGFAEEVVQTERLNPGGSEDLPAYSCAQNVERPERIRRPEAVIELAMQTASDQVRRTSR